jgi:hypothetical protein
LDVEYVVDDDDDIGMDFPKYGARVRMTMSMRHDIIIAMKDFLDDDTTNESLD